MKTKVELCGFEIEIEEVDGTVVVKAEKDDEVVEEFTLDCDPEEGAESEDDEVKNFDDFEEEEDFEGSEELEDDDSEENEEGEEEEETPALESFQSFLKKRK